MSAFRDDPTLSPLPQGTRDLHSSFSSASRIDGVYLRIKTIYHDKVLPNIGLVFIVLSQLLNSIMIMSTKLLETDPDFDKPIHPLQILFVRMSITFGGCYAYLKYIKREENIAGPKELRWLLLLRGLTGFVGVFCMYYSLLYLSVSDATVITFLVPSVTGFLAWTILRERWSLIEAGGAVISLLGVVLIARPAFLFGTPLSSGNGAESSDPKERLTATFVALCGVVGASLVYIVIRFIGKRVHSLIMVEYFAAFTCIVSFLGLLVIPGLGFRIPHTGRQWFLFLTLGFSGFFMQFLLTEGIQREKAARASMMLYSQMVYALFWEITIWHHLPSFWSWLGITIILGSAYYVLIHKPKEPVAIEPLADVERAPTAISQPYGDRDFDYPEHRSDDVEIEDMSSPSTTVI
ncbi:CYFA0S01e12134g1_1 [Cyberlindnera fabianii]|uniref:CYFA0S01e12134g1_1 n=1 Tax=Cyberlindnera fabianii TaxID=36022 RepID=A0A061AS63_CYBFA|nr:CYFA0S01e12134g1_1 [Cyberlindnera fabianii]